MFPLFPAVLYETPEDAPGGGSAPDPAPEPDPAPPEATPPAPGPWASDLEAAFEDEATRGQVDAFLREKIQPRVTELEQATAGNRNAEKLWTDFSERPVETFVTVANELFGDDVTEAIGNVLRGEGTQEDEQILSDLENEGEAGNLPPEAKEAIEYFQTKRREEAYEAELDRVQKANPDVEIDEGLFHPFIVAAEGDFDVAIEGYKTFAETAKEKYGVNVPSPDDVPTPDPPTVVGKETPSASPAPTEPKNQTLDEALDDFFNEQSSPPTVVGTT